MHLRTRLAIALALLATVGASSAALASSARPAQADDLRALDGEWLYVEDRTEGRAIEEQGPSMGPRFALRVEEGAVVLVRGKGASLREVRMALDGSATDVENTETNSTSRYHGEWKDGAFTYDIEILRKPDNARTALIRTEFRVTADGLLGRVVVGDPPTGTGSVSLFRHPADIALPAPAKAAMADMAWLAGAWVGTKGKSSIEERWSPPAGGAMLGVSRTVSRDRMSAFEFLRLVERDGGLVYIAQPNGGTATEFVLTELGATRAVFENPRHDSPQRIVYELSAEGQLSASIGQTKGGRPQRFEFKREGG